MKWMHVWMVAAAVGGVGTPVMADAEGVLFGTRKTGAGLGITHATLDSDTGVLTKPVLAAEAQNPSWLTLSADGTKVYAVCAMSNFQGKANMGGLAAFSYDRATGAMKKINEVESSGGDPSHCSLDHTEKFLFVANYQGNKKAGEGGTIAAYAIRADGGIGERTAFDQHMGKSVDPARQTQAYAHSIMTDPSNRFVLACDLGLDKVFVYRFDEKAGTLKANEPAFAEMTPGTGPRHFAFHPNGRIVYVVQEMGSRVTTFGWDDGKGVLTNVQEVSTLPAGVDGKKNTGAEVRVHPNGKFLYATNRGEDSVAMFAIDPAACTLTLMGTVPSGGKTPRNCVIDPTGKWMIVTNHGSDNAVVFAIDGVTGKLTQKGEPVGVAYPFGPVFVPAAK